MAPTYAGAFNFVDGADADVEYEYDPNGNMTKDLNKNISSIKYNSLKFFLNKCFRKKPPSKSFTNVFFTEQYSKYPHLLRSCIITRNRCHHLPYIERQCANVLFHRLLVQL